jgi:hypothetical protein
MSEDGRIFQYKTEDAHVAIGRVGRRWFVSVGPVSGRVRKAKRPERSVWDDERPERAVAKAMQWARMA